MPAGSAIIPELDERFTQSLRTPYARMVHFWQLWNLDAARKGREQIPWDEWGLVGNTYDPSRVSERAWNAFNTIGAEQASNARGWSSPPREWTPQPFSDRATPGVFRAGTIQPQAATSAPVSTPVSTPTATTQATTTAPLPQLFGQAQSAAPLTVGRLPSSHSQMQTAPQQVSPLMQMFNFPRLRTKKPAQATGGGMPGVGQYNPGFWNAWRL